VASATAARRRLLVACVHVGLILPSFYFNDLTVDVRDLARFAGDLGASCPASEGGRRVQSVAAQGLEMPVLVGASAFGDLAERS
jgi:hypothetical protein